MDAQFNWCRKIEALISLPAPKSAGFATRDSFFEARWYVDSEESVLAAAMNLSSAIVERVDAVFADMDKPQHPGAALLVIDRDEIVYLKCYGLADLETQRPITADTSFYLASVSKQFTAMAIMLLAEQGKLSFEDRLPVYFPRFPSWGTEITLRHVLHHTAGLGGYGRFFSSAETLAEWTRDLNGATNEGVLEGVMGLSGPDFPAGSQYAYCDTGYVLLAMIVAIVSGQSFADFLKANVFDPLGMKLTLVYDTSRPVLHKLAQGYIDFEKTGQFERWDYPLLTAGDGGLFSTLDDLFLWDQALNTERLVPKAALERAFTSGTINDGTPLGYGFGWYTNVFPDLRHVAHGGGLVAYNYNVFPMRHIAHGGSLVAFNNYIIRFLDSRRTIIVLTNRGPIEPVLQPGGIRGPRPRANQVAEILFSD
jgi:CubicO group peptidase (beta-lactamase class C family)